MTMIGDGFTAAATELRSTQKQALYQIVVAVSDVGSALEACRMLRTLPGGIKDFRLYDALSCAMIVCYARPFKKSKPLGRLPDEWSKFARSEFQDAHDDLVDARDRFIAHSDMTIRQVSICGPGTRAGQTELFLGRDPGDIGVSISTQQFGPERLEVIEATILDLGTRLDATKQHALDELYGGMDLPRGAFELRFDEGL
jgi:hypothetical protein